MFGFSYTDIFWPNDRVDFPVGSISFPCFNGEVFWTATMETDVHWGEGSETYMMCEQL